MSYFQISGGKIQEMFKYVVGCSTGAIVGAAIAKVFDPIRVQGIYFGLLDTVFEAYCKPYHSDVMKLALVGVFGSGRLTELTGNKYNSSSIKTTTILWQNCFHISPFYYRLMVLSTRADVWPVKTVVHRSYDSPLTTMPDEDEPTSMAEVLRVSALAPTFFNITDNDKFLDGGLLNNNPTCAALQEFTLIENRLRTEGELPWNKNVSKMNIINNPIFTTCQNEIAQ